MLYGKEKQDLFVCMNVVEREMRLCMRCLRMLLRL